MKICRVAALVWMLGMSGPALGAGLAGSSQDHRASAAAERRKGVAQEKVGDGADQARRRRFLGALDGGRLREAGRWYRRIVAEHDKTPVEVFVDDVLRQVDQVERARRVAVAGALVEAVVATLRRRARSSFGKAMVALLEGYAKREPMAKLELRVRSAVAVAGQGSRRLVALRWQCWILVQDHQLTRARAACARATTLSAHVQGLPRLDGVNTGGETPLVDRLVVEMLPDKERNSAKTLARLTRLLEVDPADVHTARLLLEVGFSTGERSASVAARVLGSVRALRGCGRLRAALGVVSLLVKRSARLASGWLEKAECLAALGDRSKAVATLRRAASLFKGSVPIRLRLARLLMPEHVLEAIRVLEAAVAIDPSSKEARRALAKAREDLAARRARMRPARLTLLDGKLMRMWFTTHGATPRALVLKGAKYRERRKQPGPGFAPLVADKELRRQVNLVRTWSDYWLPLRLYFVASSFGFPSWNEEQDWERIRFDQRSKSWRPVRKGEKHAVRVGGEWVLGYRWPVHYEGMAPPPVVVERRYRLDPDHRYAWEMEVEVTNKSDRKQRVQLAIQVPTYDRFAEKRSFFNPISLMREAVCMVGSKVRMQTLPGLFGGKSGCMGCDASSCACRRSPAKGNKESRDIPAISSHERWMNFSGLVRWIGVDEMYFLFAIAPGVKKDSVCTLLGRDLPGKHHGVLSARWVGPATNLPKRGSSLVVRFKVFSGPKVQEELDGVRVGSLDPKLGESVDYGFFWVIGRPMIWLMKRLHAVVGNWGLAIILLTLLIKLLTLPLTMKQMRSMKGMAKLKPEMDALKEKYGDDKQRFQQEMWSLYKAHKINPLGGCFPMLIQMPIYIAWYQALMVSVDLYNAPLFGWISDLTKPDTISIAGFGVPILPLLMGATMFLQQRMTPTTVDSAQQKMMMYMMPAMFTFFMLFLPSGLTLYILTNTVLTMMHQWYMNHSE